MQLKLIFFAAIIVFGVKLVLTDGDFDSDGDDDDDGGGKGEGFKVLKRCAKEFSVSGEDARGMITGNFSAITENIQCFVKCVMTGNKGTDQDNNFNPEVLIEKFASIFNREKVEKPKQNCEEVSDESSCEEAFTIFKCLRQKHKKQ